MGISGELFRIHKDELKEVQDDEEAFKNEVFNFEKKKFYRHGETIESYAGKQGQFKIKTYGGENDEDNEDNENYPGEEIDTPWFKTDNNNNNNENNNNDNNDNNDNLEEPPLKKQRLTTKKSIITKNVTNTNTNNINNNINNSNKDVKINDTENFNFDENFNLSAVYKMNNDPKKEITLPTDVMLSILKFCDIDTLISPISLVSRSWYKLSEHLSKTLFFKRWPNPSRYFMHHLLNRISNAHQSDSSNWKQEYVAQAKRDAKNLDANYANICSTWHAIHYGITGTSSENTEFPLGFILSGPEIGPELAFGKARVLYPNDVQELHQKLQKITPYCLFQRLFLTNKNLPTLMGFFEDITIKRDAEYILTNYRTLRSFIANTAQNLPHHCVLFNLG